MLCYLKCLLTCKKLYDSQVLLCIFNTLICYVKFELFFMCKFTYIFFINLILQLKMYTVILKYELFKFCYIVQVHKNDATININIITNIIFIWFLKDFII